MNPLLPYMLPISGLQNGVHEYTFDVDDTFFSCFDNALISSGNFNVSLRLDKRFDMMLLYFQFDGYANTECDRCLTSIQLPLSGEQTLIVKTASAESEEDDIIYITPDTPTLDVSQYVYEIISLTMPLIKVYDCQTTPSPPCDQSMLRYLNEQEQTTETPKDNPIWDSLKNIKYN
ncbi:MAG: DUF177 domain-containing protein [Saprospiraceae bacterium]|nr:DUF177 domain-containing protein [Saprospiraceae bacterium]MBP7699480.1 DUF177 domain-containing protein [Saprospiraceae bacterium]